MSRTLRRTLSTLTRSIAMSVAIAGLAMTSAQAADLVKLRFQQAFAPSASDAPLYVALAKGYFKDEGLDVEFRRSTDPSNAVSLVAAGEAQVGMSYPPDIMLAAEKGLPITGIYSWYQVNQFGIVSLADGANIRTPKDLVGKHIGLTSLPIDQLLFDAMLERAGITRAQMEVVNPGFSGGDLVGQRKLDGASGVPWYEVDGLKALDMKPVLMTYRDNGAPDFPFTVLIANTKYAQDNPATMKAYLRAVRKGMEYTKDHPEEALDILLTAVPTLHRKKQETAMRTIGPMRETALTASNGLGYVDLVQLQTLADFLHGRKALKTDMKASTVFTNAYR
jgi:ABC-type nitrate/sulfonate/bicarbonate transport system substrate-binding protein